MDALFLNLKNSSPYEVPLPQQANSKLSPLQMSKLSTQAFMTLLLIGFMMGANHVSARFAFNDGLDITTAVLARSSITCLIVMSLLVFQRIPRTLTSLQKKYLLIVGLLLSVQSFCIYAAVARIPVALALLAFNTYPLMVALLSKLLFKEKIEPKVLWLMPLILIGLTLALDVFGAASGLGAQAQWQLIGVGVVFALVSALTFTTALLITQHKTPGLDGRIRSACSMGTVAIVSLVLCALQGGPHFPQHIPGWIGMGLFIFLYGTAFTIMFTVLPKLGAVGNTSIMNVEPICALVLAWLILDQQISAVQVLGALIVVSGAVMLGLRK
jgi:drug/metabolite transporter (DMT)-like permease